jgi:short-subunit dehydrogenase
VIVSAASMAGRTGAPRLAHGAAGKFAAAGFTQGLPKEAQGGGGGASA